MPGLSLPAAVAAIQGPDNHIAGIHRLFLTSDGRRNAPVSADKMMLGRIQGGAVRLGPAARQLGLAEGIENGLSVVQMHPGKSVWCSLSVTNFATISLPSIVEEITLYLDGDAPDSQAARTAARAAVKLMETGRQVRIARAPEGADFNDILRASTEPPALKTAAHV